MTQTSKESRFSCRPLNKGQGLRGGGGGGSGSPGASQGQSQEERPEWGGAALN